MILTSNIWDAVNEMYREWCRLKGYKLPTSSIEYLIDEATGAEKARMQEFAEFFREDVLGRMPR